jgi:hypothetical protein
MGKKLLTTKDTKIQEGGFQTRPYFFLRPLRSLRPLFFSLAASTFTRQSFS